jgi:hypothetical protein
MENRERPDLTDPELDALLHTWKTPIAPPRLRSAVFPKQSVAWYRRWWAASVRIPLPVAAVVCALLLIAGWQWGTRKERARAESVLNSLASAPPSVTFQGFLPVAELRPRIIRSHHARN